MKRIGWIDDLKGFAIVLIVLGHVLATVRILSKGSSAEPALDAAFNYIYSFHVPLFFLLAGLTYSFKANFREFAKRRFLRLMVPYFVWGMLSAMLFVLVGRLAISNLGSEAYAQKAFVGAWWVPFVSILHGGGWPDGKGFSFNGVLWFLPVLFLCEVVYYPIAKRVRGTLSMAIVCSLIAIVLSPVYWPVATTRLPYGITWVVGYLPYVMIGDWLGRVFLKNEWGNEKRKSWVWLLYVGALAGGAGLCPLFSEVIRYPKIVFLAFVTIIPLLLIARLRIFKWFAILAPHTLSIMIFHKFLLIPMQIVVAKIGALPTCPVIGSIVCVFLFLFVCVAVCVAVSKALIRYLPRSIGVL